MADHTTGTREEWLAARLELLKAEKELTRRGDELAQRRQQLPWVRIDKRYGSGPTTRRGVRPARRSRTASTASPSIWRTTTSRFRRCRGRLSRRSRRTNGGWDGRFPGHPHSAATSTLTSTSGSPSSNSARGVSNTTTGASRRGSYAPMKGWRVACQGCLSAITRP